MAGLEYFTKRLRNGAFTQLTSTTVYNDYPRATIICSRERLSTTIIMHWDPDTPTRTHQHAWPRTLPHASTPRSHTHEHVLGRSHLDVLPLVHAQSLALTPARTHTHLPTDTQIAATAATKKNVRHHVVGSQLRGCTSAPDVDVPAPELRTCDMDFVMDHT